MKRTIHQILAIIFAGGLLISIIGVPVNDHYCGDSFISKTIGMSLEDPCGDMPMEGDCCDDEIVIFSVTDYFNSPDISVVKKFAPVTLICNYTECIKLIPRTEEIELFAEYVPPPIESKIFIEIQSFLL